MSRTSKFSTSFDRPIFCHTPVEFYHSRAFSHTHDITVMHVCTSNNSTWGHEEHVIHMYIFIGCACSSNCKDMHTCTRFDMCTHTLEEYVHVGDRVPHLDRPRYSIFMCHSQTLPHPYDNVIGGACMTRCSQPRCSGSCIVPILFIGRANPPHHHHHPRLSVPVCTHVCKYAMYIHTKVSKSSTSNGRTPPPATTPGIQHHEVCTK